MQGKLRDNVWHMTSACSGQLKDTLPLPPAHLCKFLEEDDGLVEGGVVIARLVPRAVADREGGGVEAAVALLRVASVIKRGWERDQESGSGRDGVGWAGVDADLGKQLLSHMHVSTLAFILPSSAGIHEF